MKTKYLIYILILITLTSILKSQNLSLVAGLNDDKSVILRWFSNSTFNIEGVNIYRRLITENNWTKLNTYPVKRSEEVSKNSKDTLKQLFSALVYNKPDNPDDEQIWKLTVLAKGILDTAFSEFFGMQYIDRNVETGKTYEYKIVRILNNNETESSNSVKIKIDKFLKNDAPMNFTFKEKDNYITFKWNNDKKKFFAYNIYRSETSGGNKIKINQYPIIIFYFTDKNGNQTTAEDFAKDTNITIGKTYFYELTGIDFLGKESKPTNELKVTTKDLTPPPAAFNLKTVFKNDNVIISWQIEKVKDLKEQNIYRGNSFQGPFTKLNKSPLKSTDSTYNDLIKNADQFYYYYVETVDFSGNINKSYPTLCVIPDLTPPATPVDLKATGEIGRVILTWKNNKENDLAGYFIWRSMTGEEDDFLLLTTQPYKTNTYIDSLDKEISNLITYRIKALDKSFNESDYSKPVKVKMKDITPPERPILTDISNNKNGFEIKWIMNQENDLLGYDIYIASELNTNSFKKINSKPIKDSYYKFIDTALSDGHYLFYITAIDSTGNISEKSDTLSCGFISEKFKSLSLKIISIDYQKDKNKVIIKWEKVKNVIGYIVFRRDKNEELPETISEFITTEYFEDLETEKDKFYYSIKAYDNEGNIYNSEEMMPSVK